MLTKDDVDRVLPLAVDLAECLYPLADDTIETQKLLREERRRNAVIKLLPSFLLASAVKDLVRAVDSLHEIV